MMKSRRSFLLAIGMAVIGILCVVWVATDESVNARPTPHDPWKHYEKERDKIYQRMKYEGVTRESISELIEISRPVAPGMSEDPKNIKILAEKVLNPGEHYRVEVDEYIMTMLIPDAKPGSSWMVPYADTRSPEGKKQLSEFPHELELLNLMWYIGGGGHMSMYVKCHAAGAKYRTPEISLETARKRQLTLVPTPEEEADAYRTNSFLSKAGKRIYIAPEKVVINGRIWSREALQQGHRRKYQYKTTLLPDRMIWVTIYMPSFNYVKHPDRAEHPEWLKRAFAVMDETISSIRIARLKDDGKPDPFVLERVEVAPLPVRPVMNQ